MRNMAQQQQNPGTLYNALTAGSKIIGTIVADSDIRIDGKVEGDLQCSGKVVIGEQGSLEGTVECQNAEIMGSLDGKLTVHQTLAMRSTSRLKGEVKTQVLIVEPNAVFNGTCNMTQEVPTPAEENK